MDLCGSTTLDAPSSIGSIITSELGPLKTLSYVMPTVRLAKILGIANVCGPISQ